MLESMLEVMLEFVPQRAALWQHCGREAGASTRRAMSPFFFTANSYHCLHQHASHARYTHAGWGGTEHRSLPVPAAPHQPPPSPFLYCVGRGRLRSGADGLSAADEVPARLSCCCCCCCCYNSGIAPGVAAAAAAVAVDDGVGYDNDNDVDDVVNDDDNGCGFASNGWRFCKGFLHLHYTAYMAVLSFRSFSTARLASICMAGSNGSTLFLTALLGIMLLHDPRNAKLAHARMVFGAQSLIPASANLRAKDV
eukprot:scaffold69181_cov24-Tisochrysis_lutea.AAC.2